MAKERKLTLKQKGFVKDYVKKKNGTQAIVDNFDTDDRNTAGVMAHEYLRKPKIINAIDKALVGVGLTDTVVATIHKRNMTQDKDLRVSQTAVKDYYGVTGKLEKAGDNTQVNVAFIINKKG